MPKKKDPQTALLEDIHLQLKRQNSFGFIFMRGILRGIGTALGATVLVALVTSIAIQFTGSGEITSFLKSILTALFAG